MPSPLSEDEIERLARRRAGAKLGFFLHLTVYVLVNAVMFIAASQGLTRRPWQVYPALGWGVGVFMHGFAVFVLGRGSDLRERLVERERERIRQRQNGR